MFGTAAGIRGEGEKHFIIASHPDGTFTYAMACYESIYGRVESSQQIEDETVTIKVSIPSNTTGEVILSNS
jgi:alpha-L-rhamnosidase